MALEVARLGKWMVQSPRKTLRMGQTEMERTQKKYTGGVYRVALNSCLFAVIIGQSKLTLE